MGAAGALIPMSGVARGQEPAGPLEEVLPARASASSPYLSLGSLRLHPCCPAFPDDSGLQRSGLLKGELRHANKKREKLALESFGVRKRTLKPAFGILSELNCAVRRESGLW